MAAPTTHRTSRSRRAVLKAAGQGCTLGALVSALGHAAAPDSAEMNRSIVGSTCLSLYYRNGAGVRFDDEYYLNRHLGMLMENYGSEAIERLEFRIPILAADAEPLPYVGLASIWIRDAEAFAAAGAAHGAAVAADVRNFTNASFFVQNEIVWGEAGGDLVSPRSGQSCKTVLYPWQNAARWDADYYRDRHMQLLMGLYGTQAVRRFELRKPTPQPPGTNPAFLGTASIYVEDEARFLAAAAEHAPTLMADVSNFSSVAPLLIPTVIFVA